MTRTCSSHSATTTISRARASSGPTGRRLRLGSSRRACGSAECSATTTTRLGRGAYELKTLGMPGRYYTAQARGGRPALLPRLERDHDHGRRGWLEEQLSQSTATWKIALFHHPPYTCGGHSGDTRRRRKLGAALRAVRRPARPLRARPRLPALRGAKRRHVRRPRRRRGCRSIGSARCPSSYPPARAAILRARLPVRVRDGRAARRVRRGPARPACATTCRLTP